MNLQKRLLLAGGILTAFAGIVEQTFNLSRHFGQSPWIFRSLLFILVAFLLTSWIRDDLSARSKLINPDLLPLNVETEDQLIGRSQDVKDLAALCARCPEVHLVGESGVGKSVLLHAGLVPILSRGGLLRPISISFLGEDWEHGPKAALVGAFESHVSRDDQVKLGLSANPDFREVSSALRRFKIVLGATPLIILDQFDDYLVRHRLQLLAGDHRAWLTAEQLVSKNHFWSSIAGLVRRHCTHILFVTHIGEADGLHSVRFGPPEVYRLSRLEAGFIRPLLHRLTAQQLASNPDNGWTALQERLATDLSRDGWVLPVQMRVVFQGLASLRNLTLGEYNRVGGLRGIEANLIERHLLAASEFSRIAVNALRRLLLQLVDREGRKSIALGRHLLARALAAKEILNSRESAESAVAEALSYLRDKGILRESIDPDSSTPSFALYHDYLCRGVLEAARRANRREAFLRERFRSHDQATGRLWQRWTTLLRPYELLATLYHRMRGDLVFGDMSSYIRASTLRLIPYIAASLLLILAADRGFDFPGSQTIRDLLDTSSLSVLRPTYSMQEVRARTAKYRRELSQLLLSRMNAENWIRSSPDPGAQRDDAWNQSQALCALLRTPEAGAFSSRLVSALEHLYDPKHEVLFDNKAFGWEPSQGEGFTRAESIFWAGCATALAARYERDANDVVRNRLSYLDLSAEQYRGARNGSWNTFPNQVSRSQNSVYIAALDLLMLLERHDAARTSGQAYLWCNENKRDLTNTVSWLYSHYDAHMHGWREGIDQQLSDGLTLEIYSLLLRAESDLKIPLTDPIVKEIPLYLERKLRVVDMGPVTMRYQVIFTPPGAVLKRNEAVIVTFLTLPWAIECSIRWIEREEARHEGRATLLKKRLSFWLMETMPKVMVDIDHQYTFQSSELLYALGTLAQSRELDE